MTIKKSAQAFADVDSKVYHSSSKIMDIRMEQPQVCLSKSIRHSLQGTNDIGPSIPQTLLWNDDGLKLFESITRLEEYYLTQDELEIFEQRSEDLALMIKPYSLMIDLGSGNPLKISFLLRALEKMGRSVDYIALDLSLPELQRNIGMLSSNVFHHVRCHGLLGTYEDARAWLQLPENLQRPKCVVSLGSSIGNFAPDKAVEFLSGFAEILKGKGPRLGEGQRRSVETGSLIIVGLDACKSGERIHRAYNDFYGLNRQFMLNALDHANSVLGYKAFHSDDWTVRGVWSEQTGCHDQYLVPLKDVEFEDVQLPAGEMVHIVHSYKYDALEKVQLWEKTGLREAEEWRRTDEYYGETRLFVPLYQITITWGTGINKTISVLKVDNPK
ncbi:hypothetical protein MMC30_002790 [Trapelia coarctata]|nr:hypothetical protein [Trapelia coarctata]